MKRRKFVANYLSNYVRCIITYTGVKQIENLTNVWESQRSRSKPNHNRAKIKLRIVRIVISQKSNYNKQISKTKAKFENLIKKNCCLIRLENDAI